MRLHSEKVLVSFIFIIALIPRLVIAFTLQTIPTFDAVGYDQRALSILNGKGYSFNNKPTAVKPPLYSIFLAGIYRIFGHNYLYVRIIQSIIGAFTCLVIYLLARDSLGRIVGILSATLSIFYPVFIKSSVHLLTECLIILIISLIGLYILKLSQSNKLKDAVLLGLLMGISLLTRSAMLFFIPVILLLIVFDWILVRRQIKYPILIAVMVTSVLIISPWLIRNYIIYRAFIPGGTQAGEVLYTSYNPPKGYLYGFTANDKVMSFANTIDNEVEKSRFLFKQALISIKGKIKELPRLELLKILFFWSPFDWEILLGASGKGIYNFFYTFYLPFSILGMVMLRKNFKNYIALFIPVIFFQLLAVVFFGSPRYRMAIEPFLIIFAATGIYYIYNGLFRKKLFYILIFLLFSFNFLIYLYSDNLRIISKYILRILGLWG